MNNFWKRVIVNSIYRQKRNLGGIVKEYSEYEIAKGFRQLKTTVKRCSVNAFLIAIGVIVAGFGLKSFLLPNHFIDGGAVGISLLIDQKSELPLSILLILVNIPFIILGFTTIGKKFGFKTIVSIIALALAVELIEYPQLTDDKLLVAVFGGFFLGAGIGLAMRGGSVIDGTEILAINISKKTGLTVGDTILIFNIIIFSVAAYLLSMEIALYSILTYLSAAKTVDFILEGIEEYTGVTIISPRSERIRQMIIEELGRGVTIYKGERGFGKHGHNEGKIDIVYTVITRLEVANLKAEVEKIDSDAFIIMTSIKDTTGGMIKKRAHKH